MVHKDILSMNLLALYELPPFAPIIPVIRCIALGGEDAPTPYSWELCVWSLLIHSARHIDASAGGPELAACDANQDRVAVAFTPKDQVLT